MKKILLILSAICLLAGNAFVNYPIELISKTIKKSGKKISRVKSGLHNFVDSLDFYGKSLSKIATYFPQYQLFRTSSNVSDVSYILSEVIEPASIFYDKEAGTRLVNKIDEWIGVPYRSGGKSKRGVDCSNFTSALIKEAIGICIPPGACVQAKLFKPIKVLSNLRFGDLIFFTGRNKRAHNIGHVGVYIGNGLFVHSSSGKGVIFTHISEGYYMERFKQGGRFYKNDWEFAQILNKFIKAA